MNERPLDLRTFEGLGHGSDLLSLGVEFFRREVAYQTQHEMAVDIPPVMHFMEALTHAPDTCTAVSTCRSPRQLFSLIEGYLKQVLGGKTVAGRWSDGLWHYHHYLEPARLQSLARELVEKYGSTRPKEVRAAFSLYAYALHGLSHALHTKEGRTQPNPTQECADCYKTPLSPSHYCGEHQWLRPARRDGRPRNETSCNRQALRWRARGIAMIARELLRDKTKIYFELSWLLSLATSDFLKTLPPSSPYTYLVLERTFDCRFLEGDRISRNGAKWLLYLWEVLPRIRAPLGNDWKSVIAKAYVHGNWSEVLTRLRILDPANETTDAARWAEVLIRAEAWLEAKEIEHVGRRPRGRPQQPADDPQTHLMQIAVDHGIPVQAIARWRGVSTRTIYRHLKKKAQRAQLTED